MKNGCDENVKYLYAQPESNENFNIVGKSQTIAQLIDKAKKVSRTNASVMIYGESGTGKELLARGIHFNSSRRLESFVPVDCVALPESLFESELFGHEKGAFTGAQFMQKGLIESAYQGTLFLDEICELPPNLQAKLLRVLQEREFRRIGSNKLIKTNIRIISATNRNPEEAVEIGRLREDLYYRLNVIPIELPPLRKRKEDISILVNYYIKRFCTSNKLETINIDDDAMFALQNYEWPGNIRQLKNVVEQLVSLVEGATIHYKDIPEFITTSTIYKNANINRLSDLPYWEAKKQILMEFEKEYFGNLLKRCNGNVTRASQIAQVSRRTFYQKMSAHQLYN